MVQTRVEELQGAEETERRSKEKAAKEAAAEAAAEKRKATQARVERMKEWDDEEVRMLEKALEKFPQVSTALPVAVTPFVLRKAEVTWRCWMVQSMQKAPEDISWVSMQSRLCLLLQVRVAF